MRIASSLFARFAAVATLTLATLSSAHATLITFEGFDGLVQSTNGGSLVIGDYKFTLTDVSLGFEQVTNQQTIIESNTTKLFAANHALITLSRVDGQTFRLDSFDLGGSWVDQASWIRWADTVTAANGSENVLGDLGTHASATYLHMNTGFNDFTTSVVFRPTENAGVPGDNNYEFVLDNLSITDRTAVPEPGSLALLGVALAALGVRRKRAGT